MLNHIDFIQRIAIGAACGGLIGFERDVHGRHVGLRTHLLVAMTAATFMVISSHFIFFQDYGRNEPVEVDASRIAASVVSGIGFLAGGAILRTGVTIQGITTAAGLWLVTAIGLSAGAGMFVESGFVTLMGLVALTVLRRFEDKDDATIRRKVSLRLKNHPDVLTGILEQLNAASAKVGDLDYERNISEDQVLVCFDVQIPLSFGLPKLTHLLETFEGALMVRVETV